ncbi:hypothetical protein B9Z55_017820 [Caenorhabditis nigoni]|uniref:NR LBD domain-containing protein n=1 Tax=Caenorhabditis nigoni TaxID=1611254 RepID=A0A2G5TBE1_9PELO|nr:hypothetical protein B9Z55_017820 [Caenorhabditis nigoni]
MLRYLYSVAFSIPVHVSGYWGNSNLSSPIGGFANEIQTNRDKISSKIAPSLSNFLGRPEFILCLEPDKASHIKTIIDVSYLIKKAENIFQQPDSISPMIYENSLDKLLMELEEMKTRKSKEKIPVVKYIGKFEYLMFWETTFVSAAKWLARIAGFQDLEISVKIDILKSVWMLWARLDKLSETAEYQRGQKLKNNVYMWTEETCMDLKTVEIDLKWCTNYSTEQMLFYLAPDSDSSWKETIERLIELEPTNVELNFMLIQLCLQHASMRKQGKVLEATDRILQIQADNLHHYYTNILKMPRYSNRLEKLLKVNKLVESSVRLRRDRNQISKLFDVFSIDFSHPEMFELT